MKFVRSIILFALIFVAFGLKAQDTIVKTNGMVISCNVLEVGTNAVSYKKADAKDNQTYTDLKSDIELIKYKSGKLQTFSEAENIPSVNTSTVIPNPQTQQISSNQNYNQKIE